MLLEARKLFISFKKKLEEFVDIVMSAHWNKHGSDVAWQLLGKAVKKDVKENMKEIVKTKLG